jgi:hypothetical protein
MHTGYFPHAPVHKKSPETVQLPLTAALFGSGHHNHQDMTIKKLLVLAGNRVKVKKITGQGPARSPEHF